MLHAIIVTQFQKTLTNLSAILDKAATFASTKEQEPGALLQARLAPDQFPLVRQLQIACDTAKLGAARLTGKEAPVHADTEATFDEIKARIQSVIAYLGSYSPADFEGLEGRTVSQPRWEGKYLTAHEYAVEHAIPNFFFHVTTAYAILRHNGLDIGKKDYLGPLPLKAPQA
jgi:hypothetical protein